MYLPLQEIEVGCDQFQTVLHWLLQRNGSIHTGILPALESVAEALLKSSYLSRLSNDFCIQQRENSVEFQNSSQFYCFIG